MKKKSILLVILFLLANNVLCQTNLSRIPYFKLETIEKIRLGLTSEKFSNEMEQLKIKNENFSSNWFMNKKLASGKIDSYLINFFFTEVFNFDEFKILDKLIEHPALIHSESIDNKKISSIVLLLGHTGEAFNTIKDKPSKEKFRYFKQDLSQDLFFKIIDLYGQKYGKPKMLQDSTRQIKYYRLYENKILTENEESYTNYILKWETKYFYVEIFPGFNMNAFYIPNKTYSTSTNWVSSNNSGQPLQPNEKKCFTFPYIKYSLNKLGMKLLII